MEELQRKVDRFPRVNLVNLPTPLEEMPRLTKLLGGPRLWVKREDCTGLAFGGNKERKTEFAFGDALHKKTDVVVTTGPVQSNHSRATAAAACRLGLKIILVLTGEEPALYDGNLLLDSLLGAEIHFLHGPSQKLNRTRYMKEIAEDLRQNDHTPYIIPAGASYPPGAIAYVNAMLELLEQAGNSDFRVDHIVHGAGSGGTQAGLILATKAIGLKATILGVCAEPHSQDHLTGATLEIARSTAQILDVDMDLKSDDVVLNENYAGEAYEVPTSEAVKAIRLLAQTEGILLDPIYTGRAMAGLLNLIEQGYFTKDDNVVFIHTGGTPALFPYRRRFASKD